MRRLIVGCGYLGLRCAGVWRKRNDEVFAVTRNASRASALKAEGIQPIVADVLQPSSLAQLPAIDSLLYAVGYDHAGGASIQDVYEQGLRNVLDHLSDACRRATYISSTGVYGGGTGDWVDEDSPCSPDRPGGAASLAAERVLLRSKFADRSIILRLAGIYGPDRLPRLNELRNGQPISASPDAYVNLIHVDDGVTVVCHTMDVARTPCLYNVTDGSPIARREYLGELASLIGAPVPRFEANTTGQFERSRGGDKKISNQKLMRELAPKLAYTDFRNGLKQALGVS